MSKLEELIKELCPNGVEYKELNSVCQFQNGFAFKSNLFVERGLPILRITNISNGELSNDDYVYFNPNDYNENLDSYIVKKGSIVIAMSGATTGKIGYNYSNNNYYLNQRVGLFKPNTIKLNNRYLYHWLTTQTNKILQVSSGSGAQPNLSSVKMMQFTIPLPPLPVQEEIVQILDNFTELTTELATELATELTARKKQYEYYRDKLLTFGDEVEWKTLGDILTIKNGKDYKQFAEGNVPVYGSGGIIAYIDKFVYDKPSVLIPRKGSIDKLYYTEQPFWTVDTIFYTIIKPFIIPKYVYYCLQKQHLEKLNTAGGVPSLTQSVLNKVLIPVPPLAEQQRIVDILDRFDKLCNNISEGLHAEFEARKKQYEYYRDKLLTFKELTKEPQDEQQYV